MNPGTRPVPPVRPRIDWLRDAYRRRSNLRTVRAAVRAGGWGMDADARAELVTVLGELIASDELSTGELIATVRVLVAMDFADIDAASVRLRSERWARRSPNPPEIEG